MADDKFFLTYNQQISELKAMLSELEAQIHPHAFEYIRGQMGIRNLADLDVLNDLPKDEIEYNKFDKQRITKAKKKNNTKKLGKMY